MSYRKDPPEVNAGSMADIAFLLLIFFLVTTVIEADTGLDRKLPRLERETPPIPSYKRNILSIILNNKGEVLINEELVPLVGLKTLAIDFLDNGGATLEDPAFCNYCQGDRDQGSSDSPTKAIISVSSHRQANYGTYITVQDELVGAYNALRNREALRLYGKTFEDMYSQYSNPEITKKDRTSLKEKLQHVRQMYPMNLVDAEVQ